MDDFSYPNYTFVLPFEKNFDKELFRGWMASYWSASIYISLTYLVLIFCGQNLMKSRNPLEIRKYLVAWNALLCIFSLSGTLRLFPEVSHVFQEYGPHQVICSKSFVEANSVSGLWSFLFVFSKFPELLDTAFIVLRKQELIFLHWFHHVATFVYCWYSYTDHPSIARFYIFMNYYVHAIMYFYFGLRALRFRIPRLFAMFVTANQIGQMFLGVAVAIYVLWLKFTVQDCGVSDNVILAASGLYFSLAILFVHLFYKNYYAKSKTLSYKKKA